MEELYYYEGRAVQFLMDRALSAPNPERDVVYNKLVFEWMRLRREFGDGEVLPPDDARFNHRQFYFESGTYTQGPNTYTFGMGKTAGGEWILYDHEDQVIGTLEEWARYTFRENVAYFIRLTF